MKSTTYSQKEGKSTADLEKSPLRGKTLVFDMEDDEEKNSDYKYYIESEEDSPKIQSNSKGNHKD